MAHKNISNNIRSNWKVNSTEESDENAMILIQGIIDYSVDVFRIKNVQIMRNALEWVQKVYGNDCARSISKWVLCLQDVT